MPMILFLALDPCTGVHDGYNGTRCANGSSMQVLNACTFTHSCTHMLYMLILSMHMYYSVTACAYTHYQNAWATVILQSCAGLCA